MRRHQREHLVALEPADVQAVALLDLQQVLQRPLFLLPVGHEHVAALVPLDVVAVASAPTSRRCGATRGTAGSWPATSGWRGCRRWPPCCCPGRGSANWSMTSGLTPGFREEQRRRQSDAAGADDDDVVDAAALITGLLRGRRSRAAAARPDAALLRPTTPAKAPSGTSMNSGRRVRSVTWSAGTPSSRKRRLIRLGQVLPPQAPMPARVTAFRSLMSRTPARISARISPRRHPLAPAHDHRRRRSALERRASAPLTHGSCTRMPAMRGAISRGAVTCTSSARSAAFGVADARHLDVAEHRALGVEHGDRCRPA